MENKPDIKATDKVVKVFPGVAMGFTRSVISHPFEIMKLRSQMKIQTGFYRNLYGGIHLSILSNSIERGAQFYLFSKMKEEGKTGAIASVKSSLISTAISLPYNVVLLRKNILSTTPMLTNRLWGSSAVLEYGRNFTGSVQFLYLYDRLKEVGIPFQIAGILTSMSVWLVTYPIDNIKNQRIAGRTIDFKRLYRGIQYPMIRSIPSSLAGMYVYETLKKNEQWIQDWVNQQK